MAPLLGRLVARPPDERAAPDHGLWVDDEEVRDLYDPAKAAAHLPEVAYGEAWGVR